MGAVVGSPIYDERVTGLLQLVRVVIMNANDRSVTEISDITGVKPEYVETVLKLASKMGIVDEQDGKFYIDDRIRYTFSSYIIEDDPVPR